MRRLLLWLRWPGRGLLLRRRGLLLRLRLLLGCRRLAHGPLHFRLRLGFRFLFGLLLNRRRLDRSTGLSLRLLAAHEFGRHALRHARHAFGKQRLAFPGQRLLGIRNQVRHLLAGTESKP